MKISYPFFILILPFQLLAFNSASVDSGIFNRLRLNAGGRYITTSYIKDLSIDIGLSLLYKRSEFKCSYVIKNYIVSRYAKDGAVYLAYYRMLKMPYNKLKFGLIAEYGEWTPYKRWDGYAYYLFGPSIVYSLFDIKNLNVNTAYNLNFIPYLRFTMYQSCSINLSFKY